MEIRKASSRAGNVFLRNGVSVLGSSGRKFRAVCALCAVGMSVTMRVQFMAVMDLEQEVSISSSVPRVDSMCCSRRLRRWFRL